jgi:hypothetical protein
MRAQPRDGKNDHAPLRFNMRVVHHKLLNKGELLEIPDRQMAGGPQEQRVIDIIGELFAFIIPITADHLQAFVV